MIKKLLRKIKKHFNEVLKLKTTPHEIALGFAIGAFIAIFPTFGLAPLIGIVIVLIFKKISKISLFSGMLVFNELVLIPIYALGYKIGEFIFSGEPTLYFKFEILNQLYTLTQRFLVRNTILAIILSFLSYFIVFYLVRYYQKEHPLGQVVEFIEANAPKNLATTTPKLTAPTH